MIGLVCCLVQFQATVVGNIYNFLIDFVFYVLLKVGLLLEVFHERRHDAQVRPMVFGLSDITDNDEKAGDDGKAKVYNLLRPVSMPLGLTAQKKTTSLAVTAPGSMPPHGFVRMECQKMTWTIEGMEEQENFRWV